MTAPQQADSALIAAIDSCATDAALRLAPDASSWGVQVATEFVAVPAACGETHVSAEAGQFSRWGRGARLTRRVREEPPPGELARVYFDRNATMSGA